MGSAGDFFHDAWYLKIMLSSRKCKYSGISVIWTSSSAPLLSSQQMKQIIINNYHNYYNLLNFLSKTLLCEPYRRNSGRYKDGTCVNILHSI